MTPSTSPLPSDLHSTPMSISMIAEEDENLSDTPLEVDVQEVDDIISNANGFDVKFFIVYVVYEFIIYPISKSY